MSTNTRFMPSSSLSRSLTGDTDTAHTVEAAAREGMAAAGVESDEPFPHELPTYHEHEHASEQTVVNTESVQPPEPRQSKRLAEIQELSEMPSYC